MQPLPKKKKKTKVPKSQGNLNKLIQNMVETRNGSISDLTPTKARYLQLDVHGFKNLPHECVNF